MLDLHDFPEDQRLYVGNQFKILVETGAARGIHAIGNDCPIPCDLKGPGKMWRNQIFRK